MFRAFFFSIVACMCRCSSFNSPLKLPTTFSYLNRKSHLIWIFWIFGILFGFGTHSKFRILLFSVNGWNDDEQNDRKSLTLFLILLKAISLKNHRAPWIRRHNLPLYLIVMDIWMNIFTHTKKKLHRITEQTTLYSSLTFRQHFPLTPNYYWKMNKIQNNERFCTNVWIEPSNSLNTIKRMTCFHGKME